MTENRTPTKEINPSSWLGMTKKEVFKENNITNEIFFMELDNYEYNLCDKCNMIDSTYDLIWIDSEDFEQKEKDNFNEAKHQSAVEIFKFSALCVDCYKTECCN